MNAHSQLARISITHLRRFLLELLDGPLIDPATLVDQVSGSGGLPGVDMADNNDVNVGLLLSHDGSFTAVNLSRRW